MNKYCHKIATYTAVIFISTQPLAADAMTAEKEAGQLSVLADDDTPTENKRRLPSETLRQIGIEDEDSPTTARLSDHAAPNTSTEQPPKAEQPLTGIISRKFASFVAWLNTDIEADLH